MPTHAELAQRRRDRISRRDPPRSFGTDHLKDLKPGRVASILSSQASGDLEKWYEFTDKMQDTDEHLAGLLEGRVDMVASRDYVVEAGRDDPDSHNAAALCRDALQASQDPYRVFADLLDGAFTGLALQEHGWFVDGRFQLSRPFWVDGRNTRYGTDWRVQVRNQNRRWVGLEEDMFIVHAPRTRATVPTKSAILRSVAWPWLFRFWAWNFWVNGAERVNNPMLSAEVPRNAKDDVRAKAMAALEELSTDHAAVLEKETGITIHDFKFASSSQVWENLIIRCEIGMTKRIQGATLNVEINETGGAFAAAESQAEQALIPRAKRDSFQLQSTVERMWFRPVLEANAWYFDREPALPRLRFIFDETLEIEPTIFQVLYESGSLKRNQVLDLAGLPKIEGEYGEQFIQPLAKAPGGLGRSSATEVTVDPPAPFPPEKMGRRPAHRKRTKLQLKLPLGRRSPTSSPSVNPLSAVLSPSSDDPTS